jgi:alanine racemase
VSSAVEAVEIRGSFSRVPLFGLGALTLAELDDVLGARVELGSSDLDHLRLVAARAAALDRVASVHLKFDSGMTRLGTTSVAELMAMAELCSRDASLRLRGVWTHFASADEPDAAQFGAQAASFTKVAETLRAACPGITVHAANTAATLREPAVHFDMVRCGIGIYGLDPFQDDPLARGLTPAMGLRSHVALVKQVPAGTRVGYGGTWQARERTTIANIPIGYGDGVRRALSNRGEVLIRERRRPIVGRISMDSMTVDLGSEGVVRMGDEVVVVGSQGRERILAEELARQVDTLNYEIACGITKRVPRRRIP